MVEVEGQGHWIFSVGFAYLFGGENAIELEKRGPEKRYKDLPTFVIKRGLATQTTISRLSGIKSRVRRYFTPGSEDSLEVAVLPYNTELSRFSEARDSGSIVSPS